MTVTTGQAATPITTFAPGSAGVREGVTTARRGEIEKTSNQRPSAPARSGCTPSTLELLSVGLPHGGSSVSSPSGPQLFSQVAVSSWLEGLKSPQPNLFSLPDAEPSREERGHRGVRPRHPSLHALTGAMARVPQAARNRVDLRLAPAPPGGSARYSWTHVVRGRRRQTAWRPLDVPPPRENGNQACSDRSWVHCSSAGWD